MCLSASRTSESAATARVSAVAREGASDIKMQSNEPLPSAHRLPNSLMVQPTITVCSFFDDC